MSRTANPYDNALAESFVATLKTECFGASIPPTNRVQAGLAELPADRRAAIDGKSVKSV